MRASASNRVVRVVGAGAVLLVMASGCSVGKSDEQTVQATTSVPAAPPSFTMIEVSPDANGPAGALPVDIDGDGRLELVVNEFGERPDDAGPTDFPPGGLSIYWREGDGLGGGEGAGPWRREVILDADHGLYFPNDLTAEDLDLDGDVDLIVPVGFFVCEFAPRIGPCGALLWLEQTGVGWQSHDIVPNGDTRFYHRGIPVDFDGDGIVDVVTVAEEQEDAEVQWYRGIEPGDFEIEATVIGAGGGSLPVIHDVDGDGDLDVGSAEYFFPGASYVWFENAADDATGPGPFVRHVMTDDLGRAIQLEVVPDLLGDGEDGWVGSNHVNTVTGEPEPPSVVSLLTPPSEPTQSWNHRPISEGIESRPTEGVAFQAAPGVFGHGDVDGDGDQDLALSGDGDDRVFWLEQTEPGLFETHVLATGFGQAAGGAIADLDDDGRAEIVFTSYETQQLVIFTPEDRETA